MFFHNCMTGNDQKNLGVSDLKDVFSTNQMEISLQTGKRTCYSYQVAFSWHAYQSDGLDLSSVTGIIANME